MLSVVVCGCCHGWRAAMHCHGPHTGQNKRASSTNALHSLHLMYRHILSGMWCNLVGAEVCMVAVGGRGQVAMFTKPRARRSILPSLNHMIKH